MAPASPTTGSDQEAIWSYFQNEGRQAFGGAGARLLHLAKRAQRLAPGGALLDIGVGNGAFAQAASDRGLVVSCLDPDERGIAGVRERLGLGDRAQVGFSQELPFPDGSFDLVCMSEVLEHLSDEVLEATLLEIHRVLVLGGTFLGTVPFHEDLERNRVVCPHCQERFHRWGHVQTFTRERLRGLFAPGFPGPRLEVRPFPDWDTLNWRGKLGGVLRLGLARLDRPGQGASLVFEARRRS